MRPHTPSADCHWDGSRRTTHPRRPLRVAATSPSRLLRAGQSGRCGRCGHHIDWYQRTDHRPIALHPAEVADHDHYLKIWALTQPKLEADFLLLDEAQDTNPVVEQIFLAQRHHAQLVMVGDSAQAIYHWRGAKDVMTGFDGTQLALSQSFRFGPDLAAEANRWPTWPTPRSA
ncbi:hypothetical protein SHIRM173S_06415 [Streptomyces hirsutus]